ncbi:hypothetical protein [Wolbachia endosymbiont of Cantharis cryptica]|uniref:TomO hydrophobic C-terminal domain-containing protein n=1 Tax=Wolbachia endosymbiont of Cantharis cryptica TaxID=3066132 RepID=UPI00376F09F8
MSKLGDYIQSTAETLPSEVSPKQNTGMPKPFPGNRTPAGKNSEVTRLLLGSRIFPTIELIGFGNTTSTPFGKLRDIAKLNPTLGAGEDKSVSSSASQQVEEKGGKENVLEKKGKSGILNSIWGSTLGSISNDLEGDKMFGNAQDATVLNGDNGDQQLKAFKSENNDLETELQKSKSTSKKLKEKLDKKASEVNRLTLDKKASEVNRLTEEKSQLEGKLNSIQQDLDAKTNELENVKSQVAKREKELKQDLANKTKELDRTKAQLTEKEQELNDVNQKVSQLEQERDTAQKDLDTKTYELGNTQVQLAEKEKEISRLSNEVTKITQEKSQLENIRDECDITKAQFTEKDKALGVANERVSQLQEELESTQAKLKQERNSTKQDLVNRTEELNGTRDQLAEKEGEISKLNDQVTQLENVKEEHDRTKTQLIEKKKELGVANERVSQLEQRIDDLNNKNKKLSAVNAQSTRQGNYASASFILSGMFAAGASLTIPYLAICITLAAVALASLAVGCCYLYKANTALNNVETNQIASGADHAVA